MTEKDIIDKAMRVAKRKDMFGKLFKWLVGGGLVTIVSGAIVFGVSKERLANELLQNREEHAVLKKTIEEQNVKLERIPVIENDIKWIRGELMREELVRTKIIRPDAVSAIPNPVVPK